jgi:hypothetical protein
MTEESLGAFVGRSPRLCRLDVRAGGLRLEKSRGSREVTVATVMNVTEPFVQTLKSARPNLAVTYRLVD